MPNETPQKDTKRSGANACYAAGYSLTVEVGDRRLTYCVQTMDELWEITRCDSVAEYRLDILEEAAMQRAAKECMQMVMRFLKDAKYGNIVSYVDGTQPFYDAIKHGVYGR